MSDILINGRFLSQPITGVQRVARELVSEIARRNWQTPAGRQCQLVCPKNIDHHAFDQLVITGCLKGQTWEQIELSRYERQKTLLNLANSAPIFRDNQVVCIHDSAIYDYPQSFNRKFLTYYQFMLPKLAERAQKIITVSEFSKQRLIHHLPALADKIICIYNGVSAQFKQVSQSEQDQALTHFGIKQPYVLYLGSREPRKNLNRLLYAWQNVQTDVESVSLVIAGGYQDHFKDIGLKSQKNVTVINRPEDQFLPALYSAAHLFIYPSLYEGFGLPVLEAMACNTPVITSNRGALKEVAGEAATLVDPESVTDIERAIKVLLDNDDLSADLKAKGLKRAQQFSWSKSVDNYFNILDQV